MPPPRCFCAAISAAIQASCQRAWAAALVLLHPPHVFAVVTAAVALSGWPAELWVVLGLLALVCSLHPGIVERPGRPLVEFVTEVYRCPAWPCAVTAAAAARGVAVRGAKGGSRK